MASTEAYIKENLSKWSAMLRQLFRENIPQSMTWSTLPEIVMVLKQVGAEGDVAHMFYPTGGGNDLKGAAVSPSEAGCIELRPNGAVQLVKPVLLSFESVRADDLQWAYFRLECEALSATNMDNEPPTETEELTEIQPGEYAPRSAWDENYHDGQRLPDGARVVVRWLSAGAWVIFAKGSVYNQVSGTYDGRHAKLTASQFRDYIANSARASD